MMHETDLQSSLSHQITATPSSLSVSLKIHGVLPTADSGDGLISSSQNDTRGCEKISTWLAHGKQWLLIYPTIRL